MYLKKYIYKTLGSVCLSGISHNKHYVHTRNYMKFILYNIILSFQQKDKEGKGKNTHQFVSVSVSNSTPCAVCNKSMANKLALRCESKSELYSSIISYCFLRCESKSELYPSIISYCFLRCESKSQLYSRHIFLAHLTQRVM